MMTILVVGASGATGKLLLEELLNSGNKLKVVIRSAERLPDYLLNHNLVEVQVASLLKLSDEELINLVKNCDAVASCLGHNISIKGIYGQPRKLVTVATQRLCQAISKNKPNKPVKYVLMNTTANRNLEINEPVSISQRLVISLIRLLLPPQLDNENAAEFLRTQIGQNSKEVEWAAVRPDGLIDENKLSKYDIYPSPIRNPIFNAGKTSRINVAHFMAKLIVNEDLWEEWKGQMPVIYNTDN